MPIKQVPTQSAQGAFLVMYVIGETVKADSVFKLSEDKFVTQHHGEMVGFKLNEFLADPDIKEITYFINEKEETNHDKES